MLLWLGYEWVTFPDVAELAGKNPSTTAFMELRRKELLREGKDGGIDHRWVAYGRISPHLRRAVLVAEDDQFYEHEGVDIKAMQDAIERDWKRRKITHGGSTITQQLAKNLYLSPSRNPVRKAREYFIARALEKHLTKKRILEIYLNVVEFGERIYGAEAAARNYFGVAASALTPRQAALLAGCLPNPRIMNPAEPNKRLRARQRMIVSRMKRWGYLVEKEVLAPRKPLAQSSRTPAPVSTPPVSDTDLVVPTQTDTSASTDPETQPEQETSTASDSTAAPPQESETTATTPPPQ